MSKGILFLSIMDFTDKGIQVVKLTPEYFAKHGWDVHYVVARDNSTYGSYYYQAEINPEAIKTYRFYMPSTKWLESVRNHTIRTIYSKLRGYVSVIRLARYGNRILKLHQIDVIYGFGPHGVLAANLLKLFHFAKGKKIVSRFFGIWDMYSCTLLKRRYLEQLFNWDILLALYLRADLCIITNDGTQGDKALKMIRSRSISAYRFWPNGVDELKLPLETSSSLNKDFSKDQEIILLTISRLRKTKRIDRGLLVLARLVDHYGLSKARYFILGDGEERTNLENLARELRIDDNVRFVGAVSNEEIKKYLNVATFFLSTYDVSNVGNPLLEAVRANKIIFTLNNGDTSRWIKHRVNGFIYDIDDKMIDTMAKDIFELSQNPSLRKEILENIRVTEKEMLWTWGERLNAELVEVEKLLPSNNLKRNQEILGFIY